MKYKICKPNKTIYCSKSKPLEEFAINKKMKDGYDNRCKSCHTIYKKERREKDVFKYYWQTKISHTNGHDFTITPNDIPGVDIETFINSRGKTEFKTNKYPTDCSYSGLEINWLTTDKTSDNGPSIDRWDNSLGYIPGNVYIVRRGINSMKGTASVESWRSTMKDLGWRSNV